MGQSAETVRLQPSTLDAFAGYVHEAEREMQHTLEGRGPFLWAEATAERMRAVLAGEIPAQLWAGKGPAKVPDGLIHDWIGAAFIPQASMANVLALIQNYDNHKNIYKPEVIESRLLHRDGPDFQIFLRLLKKKVITVVLDTDHDVHYYSVDVNRGGCRSYTTRIAEVEDAGTPRERVLAPDTGYGFLWRLDSYWRFEERAEGTHIECRAISLSRDIPLGLGWIIEPIIRKLPRESLMHTLKATREGVAVQAGC